MIRGWAWARVEVKAPIQRPSAKRVLEEIAAAAVPGIRLGKMYFYFDGPDIGHVKMSVTAKTRPFQEPMRNQIAIAVRTPCSCSDVPGGYTVSVGPVFYENNQRDA